MADFPLPPNFPFPLAEMLADQLPSKLKDGIEAVFTFEGGQAYALKYHGNTANDNAKIQALQKDLRASIVRSINRINGLVVVRDRFLKKYVIAMRDVGRKALAAGDKILPETLEMLQELLKIEAFKELRFLWDEGTEGQGEKGRKQEKAPEAPRTAAGSTRSWESPTTLTDRSIQSTGAKSTSSGGSDG